MKIVYAALRTMEIGGTVRNPGDLVPEATTWRNIRPYLERFELTPVLVCTLSAEVQEQIAAWETAVADEKQAVIDEREEAALEAEIEAELAAEQEELEKKPVAKKTTKTTSKKPASVSG